MSVIAGLAKAAGAEVLIRDEAHRGRVLPKRKWKLVVMALALVALVAFAALIAASQAPNAELLLGRKYGLSAADGAAPVSEPAAAPQMSEKEALDAYGKLPLSFIPNEGQTDKAVRYYAQGAGYGFFFTHKGATLSFAEGKGRGRPCTGPRLPRGRSPRDAHSPKRLAGKVNYLVGDDPPSGSGTCPPTGSSSTGGCGQGSTWRCEGRGAISSTSSTSSQAHRLMMCGWATAGPRDSRLGPVGNY